MFAAGKHLQVQSPFVHLVVVGRFPSRHAYCSSIFHPHIQIVYQKWKRFSFGTPLRITKGSFRFSELEQSVNVQVRQRDPSPPDGSSRRSKLGQLKEQTSGAIREGLEGIKRPLSSLLRRPGSRSGSRDRSDGAVASMTRSASREAGMGRDSSDTDIVARANESEADGGFRPARKTGKRRPSSGLR